MKDQNLPGKILIDADTHIPQSHTLTELYFNNSLGNIEASLLNFTFAKRLFPNFINDFNGPWRPLVAFTPASLVGPIRETRPWSR
jgi:hypothetical protein